MYSYGQNSGIDERRGYGIDMAKKYFFIAMAVIIMAIFGLTGCANVADSEKKDIIVVGFSQVGSESSWRVANSESMKKALCEEEGFELIFDDAKQKQENQYKAIRNFIQQQVDYIVLAPITENGWDDVLKEAKQAGIPVIIVDRQVDVSDDSLYINWVGSDFLQEGKMATEWLEGELEERGRENDEINILHVRGTNGATAQIFRTKGLQDAVDEHINWNIVSVLDGEYTEALAYEVTKEYLEKIQDTGETIDVIYSENDNMTFGVLKALDEAGIEYGGEDGIIIISFDAVRSSLERCLVGDINLCVECNPLHGPRVANLIRSIEAGNTPSKKSYVSDTYFSYDSITQEVIDERAY